MPNSIKSITQVARVAISLLPFSSNGKYPDYHTRMIGYNIRETWREVQIVREKHNDRKGISEDEVVDEIHGDDNFTGFRSHHISLV